jgi:hypothetical protein
MVQGASVTVAALTVFLEFDEPDGFTSLEAKLSVGGTVLAPDPLQIKTKPAGATDLGHPHGSADAPASLAPGEIRLLIPQSAIAALPAQFRVSVEGESHHHLRPDRLRDVAVIVRYLIA